MNCWNILGVPADADERTIKRSYAALLRVHRPDEDLEAFQRLREAYEQALNLSRWQASHQGVEEGAASVVLAEQHTPARASCQAPEPFQWLAQGDAGATPTGVAPALAMSVDHDAQKLSIEASLGDLSPRALEAAAHQAQAGSQREMFELSLLERCLADNVRGLAAAKWAIDNLHWLSPWQEVPLPADRLSVLLDRLLSHALDELRGMLSARDEQGFLARLGEWLGEDWLQQFDNRSRFSRELVDVLLAASRWSRALFETVSTRCQWTEEQAWRDGWLDQWGALQRRVELCELYAEIEGYLSRRKPDTPRAKATWLLFKPLNDSQRRRLVDSFDISEWSICEVIERKLKRDMPEVFAELAPKGGSNWREWRRSVAQWQGTGISLWSLLFATMSLQLWGSHDSPVYILGRAGIVALALVMFLLPLHAFWRLCTRCMLEVDVNISQRLLPTSWARNGKGMLLSRHILPSLFIGCVVGLAGGRVDAIALLAAIAAGTLAVVYANFSIRVGPPFVVLGDYLYRFQTQWSKALWVLGIGCILVGTFWGVQQRDELHAERAPLLMKPHGNLRLTDKECEALLLAAAGSQVQADVDSMTKLKISLCQSQLRRKSVQAVQMQGL